MRELFTVVAALLTALNPATIPGTQTPLVFSNGGLLDGGAITSQSFQTGTHRVSAICGVAAPGSTGTVSATLAILGSNDNVNFSAVGDAGSITITNGGSQGVAVAVTPFLYAYAEVQAASTATVYIYDAGDGLDAGPPGYYYTAADGGLLTDGGVITGCTAQSN